MSYELKIERLFDATPELVFDTLVDPDAQPEIFARPSAPPGCRPVHVRQRLGTNR